MADRVKNPFHIWHELKQRKVVQVITVYTASALAILQAADMILPRVGLPSWTVTLVLILLGCGLIVAIILSWIYDITPEGIKKTGELVEEEDQSSGIKYVLPGNGSGKFSMQSGKTVYSYELNADNARQASKRRNIYNYSSVVVIFAVIILFTFSSANTIPFSKRDWVVITDFENLTEKKVFDKSLYSAFTLTTNQSRYINILPRSRMLETLARMGKKDLDIVDDASGREIAVREGIELYIVPNISEVGNKFVIAAKIMEAKTGDLLRSEVVYAESEDQILGKLDILTRRLRRHMGESRYGIMSQDKPLKKVTTSSLEALKLYSQGIDRHLMMDFEGARNFYEEALKIDTGFIAAKASLGNILIEKFDAVKGRQLLSQAVRSVDNLTEREKLGILSFYAVNVENDLPKGIEYAKMRINLYPDDATSRNNLGWYYMSSGQFENALKEYKATVRIFPDMALPYGGINWIYLEKLGILDSAMIWTHKMIRDNPANPWGYFYLGSAFLGLDSLQQAEKAFSKAMEINPSFLLNNYRLAHSLRLQGRYSEAIELLKKIRKENPDESSALYDLGINYQAMGMQREARENYKAFEKIATVEWVKSYPDDPVTYFAIGAIAARLGDMETSRNMLQKSMGMDSTKHEKFAELLCLQGKLPEAIVEAEKAIKKGYRDIVWLKINPDYQALQSDPRYRQLLMKNFK